MTAYNDDSTNKPPVAPKNKIGVWDDSPLVLGAFYASPIPPNAKKPPLFGTVDFLVTCRTCLLHGQPHPKLNSVGLYLRVGNHIVAGTWQGLSVIAGLAIAAWVFL